MNVIDVDKRNIYLNGFLDNDSAYKIINSLKVIDKTEGEISLFINCSGANIDNFFAVSNIIKRLKNKLNTIITGFCTTGGILLLIGKGRKVINPKGLILLNGLFMYNKVDTVGNILKFLDEVTGDIIDIIHKLTNQNKEKIKKDIENEIWLSAEEALEYGIVDEIIDN